MVAIKKVCIVGISGKLGRYMVDECLNRGYEVTGVCREQSVGKLDEFKDRITVYGGATDDAAVVAKAVTGCDGVLAVLVPWGVDGFAQGTARAVVETAPSDARLVFSSGWHVARDDKDTYSFGLRALFGVVGVVGRLFRVFDLADQERACQYVFDGDTKWTVARGCALDEGPSQGTPRWARHIGDPVLASGLAATMRRVDFARFMVDALADDDLIHVAPALVGADSAR